MKKTIVALCASLLLITAIYAEDNTSDLGNAEIKLNDATEDIKSSLNAQDNSNDLTNMKVIKEELNKTTEETEPEDSTKGLVKVKKESIEAVKKSRDLKSADEYAYSTRWAIVIGINDFEDKFISDLAKAQNDAKALSDVLKNEGQFDFVYMFTDDSDKKSDTYPSLNNIVAKLEFLRSEIKPNDTLVFAFSGHGISDDNGRSHLIMADTKISEPYKTSLPLYEVEDWIDDLKVNKNIVLLDACRNQLEKTKAINVKTLIDEKNNQAEISAVVYSTSPGEFSYEHDNEPYGVFTTYMIDALKGKADKDNDVMVSFNEIRDYVENGVRKWALENNKKQKPYSSIKGEFTGDLILSVIPLKERAKYNPYSLKNNYRKQMNLYKGLNYSSLTSFLTGIVGAGVGGILTGVGYYQYSTLKGDYAKTDFDLYYNMTNSGIYCMIGLGSFAIASLIPYIVSFNLNPDKKKTVFMDKVGINLGFTDKMAFLGVGIKL